MQDLILYIIFILLCLIIYILISQKKNQDNDKREVELNKLKDSLLISDKNSKSKIIKSARNIPSLKIIEQEGANVYDLIKYKNVIFTTTSIKSLQDRLLK